MALYLSGGMQRIFLPCFANFTRKSHAASLQFAADLESCPIFAGM